jgi:hypothetical protein
MAPDGWFSRRVDTCIRGIDLNRVWHIAQDDLPKVKEAIGNILPSLEELERQLAETEEDEKSKK